MENTRFEIKSEGLQVIYNEAPVIIGLNKILYVYKNDDITQEVATNGIEVKDDTDEISLSSIEITDVDGRKLKGEDESKAKEKFKFKIFNKSRFASSNRSNNTNINISICTVSYILIQF